MLAKANPGLPYVSWGLATGACRRAAQSLWNLFFLALNPRWSAQFVRSTAK